MDWEIRPLARRCAATGAAFEAGQRVLCVLFSSFEEGQLQRVDVLKEESETFEIPGTPLARWAREVKAPGSDREGRQQALQSTEELFLALNVEQMASEAFGSEARAELDALRHLLALMLERKRLLKPIGQRAKSGSQTYLHVSTRTEVQVPVVAMEPTLLRRVQSRLDDLVF